MVTTLDDLRKQAEQLGYTLVPTVGVNALRSAVEALDNYAEEQFADETGEPKDGYTYFDMNMADYRERISEVAGSILFG